MNDETIVCLYTRDESARADLNFYLYTSFFSYKYIYIYIHIHTYIYIYIYLYTHMRTHTFICVYMRITRYVPSDEERITIVLRPFDRRKHVLLIARNAQMRGQKGGKDVTSMIFPCVIMQIIYIYIYIYAYMYMYMYVSHIINIMYIIYCIHIHIHTCIHIYIDSNVCTSKEIKLCIVA